jgi:hypothetical protein
MGRPPRDRLNRRVAACPEPARLEHDRPRPRTRRDSAACDRRRELVEFGSPDFPLLRAGSASAAAMSNRPSRYRTRECVDQRERAQLWRTAKTVAGQSADGLLQSFEPLSRVDTSTRPSSNTWTRTVAPTTALRHSFNSPGTLPATVCGPCVQAPSAIFAMAAHPFASLPNTLRLYRAAKRMPASPFARGGPGESGGVAGPSVVSGRSSPATSGSGER